MRAKEIERRNEILKLAPSSDPVVQQLTAAADQFIVPRGSQTTVIAGYHWFGDWGRDTMIALPGLTLETGRYDVSKTFCGPSPAVWISGMLPNRFPDAGEAPEYNTVDATLWFFEAVRALLARTGDYDFVRAHLYGSCSEIVAWHQRGTRYGIHVDIDGLLHAGEPGVQLTWMDAKVGDWVVTPRRGKPVEIQALWYNALRVMEDLARRFGDADGGRLSEGRRRARQSFAQLFWNKAAAACTMWSTEIPPMPNPAEPGLRGEPAAPMLSPEKAKAVVDTCRAGTIDAWGLRTLAPARSAVIGAGTRAMPQPRRPITRAPFGRG